MNTCSRGASQ